MIELMLQWNIRHMIRILWWQYHVGFKMWHFCVLLNLDFMSLTRLWPAVGLGFLAAPVWIDLDHNQNWSSCNAHSHQERSGTIATSASPRRVCKMSLVGLRRKVSRRPRAGLEAGSVCDLDFATSLVCHLRGLFSRSDSTGRDLDSWQLTLPIWRPLEHEQQR